MHEISKVELDPQLCEVETAIGHPRACAGTGGCDSAASVGVSGSQLACSAAASAAILVGNAARYEQRATDMMRRRTGGPSSGVEVVGSDMASRNLLTRLI
eukprot:6182233-Pleurochrysis_carterae.AAC.4